MNTIEILVLIAIIISSIIAIGYIIYQLYQKRKDKESLKRLYPDFNILFSKYGVQIVQPDDDPLDAPFYDISELRANDYDIERVIPNEFSDSSVNFIVL